MVSGENVAIPRVTSKVELLCRTQAQQSFELNAHMLMLYMHNVPHVHHHNICYLAGERSATGVEGNVIGFTGIVLLHGVKDETQFKEILERGFDFFKIHQRIKDREHLKTTFVYL